MASMLPYDIVCEIWRYLSTDNRKNLLKAHVLTKDIMITLSHKLIDDLEYEQAKEPPGYQLKCINLFLDLILFLSRA